jgi:hypothetical protein
MGNEILRETEEDSLQPPGKDNSLTRLSRTGGGARSGCAAGPDGSAGDTEIGAFRQSEFRRAPADPSLACGVEEGVKPASTSTRREDLQHSALHPGCDLARFDLVAGQHFGGIAGTANLDAKWSQPAGVEQSLGCSGIHAPRMSDSTALMS